MGKKTVKIMNWSLTFTIVYMESIETSFPPKNYLHFYQSIVSSLVLIWPEHTKNSN